MEEYDAPGLLVATTNIEASLDSALFRRFDDVFLVPPPGPAQIEELLRMTLSDVSVPEESPNMLFDGQELREMIARTPVEIELRNGHGRRYGIVSSAEALGMNLDLFVGVGNRRRIRFLRSVPSGLYSVAAAAQPGA
jgi:SpoVK/Ycf46/Vps4 family AAA+-type ATPase